MSAMRRIRPWVVVAGTLLAVFAAVTAVIWRQGDFWRASAANYLRERLAADYGAQFQTTELRGRWLPPGLSLGHVTFHRGGEPWVLTAEDVRISFNPYAVLFGRERLGRVVIDRPHLFVRASAASAPVAPSAPGQAPAAPAAPAAPGLPPPGEAGPATPGAAGFLSTFLRPPFPLRVLEVVDGRIDVTDRDGGRLVVGDVDLSLLVTKGSARALLEVAGLAVERSGRRVELGRADVDLTLGEKEIKVREIALAGGPLSGTLRGAVDTAGSLALKAELTASVEKVAALAGAPSAAAGAASFDGEITGSLRDPAASGSLAVRSLVVRGRRWPQARGRVEWGGKRLAWSQVRFAVGDGSVTTAGVADFSADAPSYRVDAEAVDVDPGRWPDVGAEIADRVTGLAGTLHWEGSGTAAGSGSLSMRITVPSFAGEPVALDVAAVLDRGALLFPSCRVASGSLDISGSGGWNRDTGFSGAVHGVVGDLKQLFPAARVELGGSGSFEGQLALDAQGPRFAGEVRVAKGAVGAVRGLEGSARIVVTGGGLRLDAGQVAWAGGRGSIGGSVEFPSGTLDLETVFRHLPLGEAARLLGVGPELPRGELEARLRVRGTVAEPLAEGVVTGTELRYRALALDAGTLTMSYAGRRLAVDRARLRRGTTELTFSGELREGRTIEGEFASAAFDLADFMPIAGAELTGSLQGRVRGPLDDAQVTSVVRAGRLRYGGFDFKGGELAADYRKGVVAVEGWVADGENRLRAVLEPGRDWRFESDLELRQFAPEMVRSGLGAFPPAVARALGRASFLAAGRLHADGRLSDPRSVKATLGLDTLWLQAGGHSLQNLAPVRISWRDGRLAVEDFRLAGDQYRLEVRGGGSLDDGWGLQAEGTVGLEVFREYWPEIEDVDGRGDLLLTLSGPWAAPQPEGSLVVREAHVRVRSLPEPLENLSGTLELRGRTLTATGLSGAIGGGEFRGGGSYELSRDRLDARVEGRLDLALFRGRVPAARELRGPVEVRLRMAGPLANPAFTGEADVLDAELFLRAFPAKITQVRGRVLATADRLEIRDLAGQTGGGTVRLNGTLDRSRQPARVDARLEGRGILVTLAGALKTQSDLDLGLHGDLNDLKLAGEVRILKARYLREFGDKLPALGAAARASDPGAAAVVDLSRLALDVKLVAADNVWISNRMANIETSVALEIGGRLGAPVVRGEITGIQGEAFYLSRQFRLESGSLRFAPPATVPVLDVQASTTVGETQILFLMDGPLNKLTYNLTSTPGMSKQDLISLLTIGETRSDLARRGDQASSAGAAVFTTEPLVNALGDEARTSMGLDTLQVEPVVGDNKEVSARVTVGTRLSDRLFVSYSKNLGAAEDEQVVVQYSLVDYLSVWGQELRQGVYSLDLVFRYAFK